MNIYENKLFVVVVGFLEENCYLFKSEKDKCVYVIDPGADAEKIMVLIKKIKTEDVRILLTHGHVDHIGAVKDLMDKLPVSLLYLNKNDLPLYQSPQNSVLPWIPAIKSPPVPKHELISSELKLITTPGHTQGSVCFYAEEKKFLFSGDTIFNGDIGRTDLPGGNHLSLMDSVKNKILLLPDTVRIFPGHGPETTVGAERKIHF